eukprot:7715897-Lingulodinium_polyedra.AAC.2
MIQTSLRGKPITTDSETLGMVQSLQSNSRGYYVFRRGSKRIDDCWDSPASGQTREKNEVHRDICTKLAQRLIVFVCIV